MGTIFKAGNAYILRSGNEKYRQDGQKKAKNFDGKDVQITGTLGDDKEVDSRCQDQSVAGHVNMPGGG